MFDNNGNLTERASAADRTVYTYDLDNRLEMVQAYEYQGGGWVLVQTVSYTYDPMGNLVKRYSNGSRENKNTTYTIDLARGLPVAWREREDATCGFLRN